MFDPYFHRSGMCVCGDVYVHVFVCLYVCLSVSYVHKIWLHTMNDTLILTCPVAMKIDVTTLAAWALNPPIEPAIAEPTRFLLVLTSISDSTLVLST